jgi:hypothetical protein
MSVGYATMQANFSAIFRTINNKKKIKIIIIIKKEKKNRNETLF